MGSFAAIVLFDLALVVPPLTVVVGILMLALPTRRRNVVAPAVTAHAA